MTTIAEYEKIPVLKAKLDGIREVVHRRPSQITLWIGAGMSAYYAKMPLWAGLLRELSQGISTEDERELVNLLVDKGKYGIAAELISENHPTLNQTICEIFKGPQSGFVINPLSRISPNTVITTNYDLLCENIFPHHDRLDPRHPIESIFSFKPKLVKLHGSIDDQDSLVLTTSSYAKTYNKEFEWYLLHLFQNTTVIFLGAGLSLNEPYIKYLSMAKDCGLLRSPHYALMPFSKLQTDKETNKTIADKSNHYQNIGIEILPYVKDSVGHDFIDEFLNELRIPVKKSHFSDYLKVTDQELQSFGPEAVGHRVFNISKNVSGSNIEKAPFINLVSKFFGLIRKGNRYDLGIQWFSDLSEMLDWYERVIHSKYASQEKEHKYKSQELMRFKAFLYDLDRRFRLTSLSKGRCPS